MRNAAKAVKENVTDTNLRDIYHQCVCFKQTQKPVAAWTLQVFNSAATKSHYCIHNSVVFMPEREISHCFVEAYKAQGVNTAEASHTHSDMHTNNTVPACAAGMNSFIPSFCLRVLQTADDAQHRHKCPALNSHYVGGLSCCRPYWPLHYIKAQSQHYFGFI